MILLLYLIILMCTYRTHILEANCFSEGSASAAPGGSVRSPRHRNPSGGHSLAASTHNAPSDEPPTKLLHIKQEIDQEVDETPPRRITRHSFAVEARKTKMSKKSSKSNAGERERERESLFCKSRSRVYISQKSKQWMSMFMC